MSEKAWESFRQVDALLGKVDQLHSSPAVACRALTLLKDPQFEVSEVEKLLETDPSLAASILRLVNSSMYGLSRKIAGLHQAVTILGIRSLRLAVLNFGLIDRLARGLPIRVCEEYWRRALTMAVVASRLCGRQSEARADEAYSAGLLADLGVLAFAQADTDAYASLCQEHAHGIDLVEQERGRYGFDHAVLGARLLSRWNLPETTIGAVRRHHDARAGEQLLDRLVVAGDMLADVLWTPGSSRLSDTRRFLESRFGLDSDGLITLAVACKDGIRESAKMFRVELPGSIDCAAILDAALGQFKAEAMATAADWDSMQAVVDHDFA